MNEQIAKRLQEIERNCKENKKYDDTVNGLDIPLNDTPQSATNISINKFNTSALKRFLAKDSNKEGSIKTGILRCFDKNEGIGLIAQDDSSVEVYAHYTDIASYKLGTDLRLEQNVEYKLRTSYYLNQLNAYDITGPNGAPILEYKEDFEVKKNW